MHVLITRDIGLIALEKTGLGEGVSNNAQSLLQGGGGEKQRKRCPKNKRHLEGEQEINKTSIFIEYLSRTKSFVDDIEAVKEPIDTACRYRASEYVISKITVPKLYNET